MSTKTIRTDTTPSYSTYLSNLPDELLLEVMWFLDVPELLQVAKVGIREARRCFMPCRSELTPTDISSPARPFA